MRNIFDRFKYRLFWSAALTAAAFAVVQPLALATGVPEVARVLPALAVLYWLDMSLLMGRVIFSPKLDFQQLAAKAAEQPSGAAVVAALLTINILFRLGWLAWVIYAI